MRPLQIIIITFFLCFILASNSYAITDPLSVPNNKIGIHILFPEELEKAAKLVNGPKGEWGYVTIPIQASDRNPKKWQKFFDDCQKYKLIPLVRVATFPEGSNWAQPNDYDLIDFANFLNELTWPTQNRYVIIFNEVNRSDEFGGYVNPEKYAEILSNASDIFKAKNPDFFILPAGLDNASINTKNSLNWRVYLERMYWHSPDVFTKIDGWNSHAYPNPAFSSRPNLSGSNKIDSFRYDLKYLNNFTVKKLPVFITETGWSMQNLPEYQISKYFDYAFDNVWNDERIVAVTPFLLNAQDGAFKVFSFLNKDGQFREFSESLTKRATRGEPNFPSLRNEEVAISTPSSEVSSVLPDHRQNSEIIKLVKDAWQNILSLLKLPSQI